MRRLERFVRLPWSDKWLLGKVWAFLWLVRVALWVLPFPLTRRWLARWSARRPLAHQLRPTPRERLVWAVRAASRWLPSEKSCLTQALVVDSLLERRSYPHALRIGVRREGGRLVAHAWVESEGAIVVGAEEHERYTPLEHPRTGSGSGS